MLAFLSEVTQPSPDWTWLTQAGSVGILAAGVLSFIRGWIVPGTQLKREIDEHAEELRQLRQERDKAMEQIYALAELAQRAFEAAERKSGV